ncbi:MAG TPA: xanthine dehydrogenase family protein subunit M [Rhizomicrobium sp.]
MIPYAFQYHRPQNLAAAESLFMNAADARYLAGGQTLIPTMKQRLASPSDLIDLSRLGLDHIRTEDRGIVVGAGTCHCDVAESGEIRSRIPALAALARSIGDPAVRHRGTLGGSLANSDPAADYPAAVLGLGATIRTTKRAIESDAYFTGMFETALQPGEIITEISFPVPGRAGYAKFRNPASGYATVGVFVAQFGAAVRLAVTGAGPFVFHGPEMEAALRKQFEPEAVTGIVISADRLNADLHASAEYRAHLVSVMAKRAIEDALHSHAELST